MTVYSYKAPSRVAKVEERHDKSYVSGVGVDATFKSVSTGWFVVTEGPSPVTVHVGGERPPHEVGDEVVIDVRITSREKRS